jgi:ribonuclease HI
VAALEELGLDCGRIYTDGGGPGEHGDTAGWGAHAVRVHADGQAEVLAQLGGPGVTDATSVWSIGCTRPTNNTADITGMAKGLELIDQRPAGRLVRLDVRGQRRREQLNGVDQPRRR